MLQASTASNKTTAPPRLVETGPSVYRWRTATSARVHPALRARIARTTSTNATGTRADTAPARTFTDRTSKSKNDIVNALSLSLSLSALHIFFRRKLRSHAPLSDKTKGEATKSKLSRLLLSFLFLSRLHFANDTTLNINFYHQFPTPGLSRHPTERFWGENRYRYEGYDRFRCLKFCYKIYFFIIIITFIHFPRTSF